MRLILIWCLIIFFVSVLVQHFYALFVLSVDISVFYHLFFGEFLWGLCKHHDRCLQTPRAREIIAHCREWRDARVGNPTTHRIDIFVAAPVDQWQFGTVGSNELIWYKFQKIATPVHAGRQHEKDTWRVFTAIYNKPVDVLEANTHFAGVSWTVGEYAQVRIEHALRRLPHDNIRRATEAMPGRMVLYEWHVGDHIVEFQWKIVILSGFYNSVDFSNQQIMKQECDLIKFK